MNLECHRLSLVPASESSADAPDSHSLAVSVEQPAIPVDDQMCLPANSERAFVRSSEKKDKPLKHKQLRALALRQRGMTQKEVAQVLRTTERSIIRWEQKPVWIAKRAELVADCINRSRELFREHAEAVSQATVDSAQIGNVHAQRTALEIAGVLESNPTGAHGGDLARALAAVQVSVRVERGKGQNDDVVTIESGQPNAISDTTPSSSEHDSGVITQDQAQTSVD